LGYASVKTFTLKQLLSFIKIAKYHSKKMGRKIPQKAAFKSANCGFNIGMQKGTPVRCAHKVHSIYERLLKTA